MDVKLYVAILNDGWIRVEYIMRVLPWLIKTSGVDVTLEDLALTWAHPISNNRNQITKRFLETDADFLLMIDNDVIPLMNPAEMVFADKDIIGFPAKVRQGLSSLNWTAYIKCPVAVSSGDSYIPVDLDAIDDKVDLLEVDAVGTGCILVKRGVLENLKAPFHCKYDEDGILTTGTDFAFCEKAKEAGYKIHTTPQRYCEHIKTVGLLQTISFLDVAHREKNPHRYSIPWGKFSIDYADWFFIKAIIKDEKIKSVLEFGCGLSSLLMSEITKVVSYETKQEWKGKVELLKTSKNDLEIKIWSGTDFLKLPLFDLVFIDGPALEKDGVSREVAFQTAIKCSDKIIVHDAGRQQEIDLQNKYLKGEFRLMKHSGYFQTSANYWIRRQENE